MAHHEEPMDIDCMESDFDNKENSYLHSNVLPCTEKGYEELDVSELNMKLRYSLTPAASPMSKSYSAYVDNRNLDFDESLNCTNENANLTRSFNSTMTKNDSVIKSLKTLPLQTISTEQIPDNRGSILRQSTVLRDDNNVTVTISEVNDINENMSLPSSSSSIVHTPEATTPTHLKNEESSPIIRGLKSVFNMFRSSQSPIPPVENEISVKEVSPLDETYCEDPKPQTLASTPISANRSRDGSSKRSSPLKDSIVFNDDLETELQWKEDTILFSEEKIPMHKLFLPQNKPALAVTTTPQKNQKDNMDTTVEYMDISHNSSMPLENTLTETHNNTLAVDSDGEFEDCVTTFTKNESQSIITINEEICKDPLKEIDVTKDSINKNKTAIYENAIIENKIETETADAPQTLDITGHKDMLENNLSIFDTVECKEDQNMCSSSAVTLDITRDIVVVTENVSNNNENLENEGTVTDMVSGINQIKSIDIEIQNEPSMDTSNPCNLTMEIECANVPAISECHLPDHVITSVVESISTKYDTSSFPKSIEDSSSLLDAKADEVQSTPDLEDKSSHEIIEISKIPNEDNQLILSAVDREEVNPEGDANITQLVENEKTAESANEIRLVNADPVTVLEPKEVVNIECSQNIIKDLSILDSTVQNISFPKNTDGSTVNNVSLTPVTENSIQIVQQLQLLSDCDTISKEDTSCFIAEGPANIPLPDVDDFDIDLESNMDKVETLEAEPHEMIDAVKAELMGSNMDKVETLKAEPHEKIDAVKAELMESNMDKVETLKAELHEEIDAVKAELMESSMDKGETLKAELHEKIDAVKAELLESNMDKVETLKAELHEEIDAVKAELMESNMDKGETLQDEPNKAIDVVKAELNHDLTKSLSEVLDDTNMTVNLLAKDTELSTMEKQDILNETHDIVNSLTEIIGESVNTTIIQSENMLDHSQYEQMEGIECADKIHVLPDIVNETIHNMSVDVTEPEIISQTQIVSEMHGMLERAFDVVPQITTISDSHHASAEQSNDSINVNKEHDQITLRTENIGVVPETNVAESKDNENTLNNTKVDVIPNAEVKEFPNLNEEIVVSENNSPYVSVIAETESKVTEESFENIDIPLDTIHPAPSSPPIRSKGYNFNFDEMDDPFAIKIKIRQSPPPVGKLIKPEFVDEVKPGAKKVPVNRRRSQPPERKRPAFNKKKLNTTIEAGSSTNSPINTSNYLNSKGDPKDDIPKNITITMDDNENDKEVALILDSTQVLDKRVEEKVDIVSENYLMNDQSEEQTVPAADTTVEISTENKSSAESMSTATSEIKTSSSEQSTYYSAAASSSDSSMSRNVFNLPEIDDMNFNPFATKSKMRQSPPLETKYENPFATKIKMRSSPDFSTEALPKPESEENITKDAEDKMDTEFMEKDSSYNISNITSSSKRTDDKNITVREVNTEDEDTEEGPFLEAEDAIDKLLEAEDDIDKLLGINNDMMQLNEIPAQVTDENADGGELFIDAEAFEFLLNKNKCNVVTDSGKESLFLKFDPLFAKRISSDGVLSALNNVQKRQSTPTKPARPSLRNEASPIPGPSTVAATYDEDASVTEDSIEDLNITVAKPMMVVTPAVNPAVTPRNKTTTPPRSNRRSITFTSPAMAVIDRLLSLSGNNSFLGQDTPVAQASREHIEADLALIQLRELLAEKEISVYQLRSESKELKDRLTTMETQVKILEADGKERLNKINELTDRLAEKTKVNKSMAAVVEEYERTIASLIAETEQDKKRHAEERIRLKNERDEQTAHLMSMEVSFTDLHSKYEKSKHLILSCKANEEACKKSIKDFEENLTKMQTNYEMLKQHATSKLNHANHELQKITKAHESEVLKMNAMIKRKDMHITSLEETLAQKTKANEELTAICDELINKVG